MGISKNNPAVRDNQRLYVFCPTCEDKECKHTVEMNLVKRVPGGMFYVCKVCNVAHPVFKGAYEQFPHVWAKKK